MKQKLKKLKKANPDKRDDPLAGDLSDFISEGGWQAFQFELKEKKDKVVSLRLSEKLFNELKKQAQAMGLDTQKFIRLSLESVIRKRAG